MRWPGKIKANSTLNGIVSHQDMLPTLLAAAGEPNINQKLLDGYKAGDKTFNVHIDGVNQLPYLTGEVKESPRKNFFYVSDDGGRYGSARGRLQAGIPGATRRKVARLAAAVHTASSA